MTLTHNKIQRTIQTLPNGKKLILGFNENYGIYDGVFHHWIVDPDDTMFFNDEILRIWQEMTRNI